MIGEKPPMSGESNRKRAALKAFIFLLFIIASITVIKFSPLKEYITIDFLSDCIDRAGIWAPVVYILVYSIGVCLFLPGTLLTLIGAAIFGPYYGFLYVWIGAMLGATGAFFIGRTLGREFAASMIGDKLQKYDDAIERNGFAAVLYLRLVYFPFTPMNFGMGLTRVRFLDYFFGTGIGIIVGTFVFTFFFGSLKEVWASGDWSQIISLKVFGALSLFIFSFFIPKIVKKIRKED
ncbi:TVP38/TMEM64 family protein [Thermodesulfobacteriota bacterium]